MRALIVLFLLAQSASGVTGLDADQCPPDDDDHTCKCTCRCIPHIVFVNAIGSKSPNKSEEDPGHIPKYCPKPFFQFVGLCTKFYKGGKVTGDMVAETCNDKMYGSYGLSFFHKHEVKWLAKGFHMVHTDVTKMWTSGKRDGSNWRWMGTGRSFEASEYDWTNDPGSGGDCVQLDNSVGKFVAVDCSEMASLTCQKDVSIS